MGVMAITQISNAQGNLAGLAGDETGGLGAASEQQDLAVVGHDRASMLSVLSSDTGITATSPGDSDKSPVQGMAPAPQITPPVPEPCTGGLLALGGATWTAGALCRRKQAH